MKWTRNGTGTDQKVQCRLVGFWLSFSLALYMWLYNVKLRISIAMFVSGISAIGYAHSLISLII
jgi:hypothetical protein